MSLRMENKFKIEKSFSTLIIKVAANQYQGKVADTKRKDLGVLCTWFEESTDSL